MPPLSAAQLRPSCRSLFEGRGVPPDEAAQVAESLVDANLCGHDSHGVIRIPQYLRAVADGSLKPGAAMTVVHETLAVLVADGGWGLGQVQAHRLLRRVVAQAPTAGPAAGARRPC